MKKGVSIIIPVYNREMFIEEAIRSILNQEYGGELEIIISDDGSTDNSIQIAKNFGDKVKILLKPEDCRTQGVASTRNRGIKYSTLPFICFLDSDDFFLPGHLEKMIYAFKKNPEIGFAFCRVLEVKAVNDIKLFKPWTRQYILKNDVINPAVSRSSIVHTNSFMFRREVFDKVGVFNEIYSNGEDSDLWMRISEQFRGKFIDFFGVAYRMIHGANQLTKNPASVIDKSHLLVFGAAKKRYKVLGLKDSKRIFKIKSYILWIKYRKITKARLIYYIKFSILIIRYPAGYFQKLIEDKMVKKESKARKNWYTLKKYIN